MSAQKQYLEYVANIDEIADAHSEEIVRHEFTQEELDQMREELSANMIELYRLKTEQKAFNDEMKDKMKPFETKNRDILTGIRYGFVEKTMNVRGIKDYENSLMLWYDENGNYVGQRRLFPNERQMRLSK